jgi:hypothetical protein
MVVVAIVFRLGHVFVDRCILVGGFLGVSAAVSGVALAMPTAGRLLLQFREGSFELWRVLRGSQRRLTARKGKRKTSDTQE